MLSVENQLFLWHESALYIGNSFDPEMHHHNAVQCCISLQGKMKIRSVSLPFWQECNAVVIGGNVDHQILNPEGPLCIVYLDKASDAYRSILDFHGVGVACAEPLLCDVPKPSCDAILSVCAIPLDSKTAAELKLQCLRALNVTFSKSKPIDTRVSNLLHCFHAQPERLFSGKELAAIVCLSESRMQHLFKQEVGIPIRAYVLWVRVRHVLRLSLSGASMSAAAHASGFSDSSHFTRTFKSMFGITPSTLLSKTAGVNIQIIDSETC